MRRVPGHGHDGPASSRHCGYRLSSRRDVQILPLWNQPSSLASTQIFLMASVTSKQLVTMLPPPVAGLMRKRLSSPSSSSSSGQESDDEAARFAADPKGTFLLDARSPWLVRGQAYQRCPCHILCMYLVAVIIYSVVVGGRTDLEGKQGGHARWAPLCLGR